MSLPPREDDGKRLDQYQVHRHDACYRHITLAMLAGVLLSVEINVVRVNRLHPGRYSPPSPKGVEHVDVNFDPPSPEPGQDDPSP
jgi:hypothetical protein